MALQYLVVTPPDGVELRLPAQVTKIHPDGTYDVRATNGSMVIMGASPDMMRLEDESGNSIAPVVEKTAEERHDIRLQAVEDALLFVADMIVGGMI